MTRICILFIISFAACVAQTDSLLWKQYVRGGGAQAEKDKGVFGYYRLNRQTPFTFRDLRFFGYGLKKESFIYVPVKNGISLNLNFEMEDYLDKDQNDASSITFAIGWDGKLKWTL